MTEDSDPPKATKTELERRQLEARPGHGKSMLSMTKLLQLLPAAALLGGIDQREVERVQALAELALVLDCSIRDLEQAAAERAYALTTERIRLWTDAAARGELGLNEILIAMEGDGLRGKSNFTVVNEPADWSALTVDEIHERFLAVSREVIDHSSVPEQLRDESQTVVFRSMPVGKSEQLQRERPEPRKRKSTFAQRAGRWR